MPKSYTDSSIVEHHEDGSRTITTVETYEPVTQKQQAIAVAGLVGLCFLPVVPLLAVAALEKADARLQARKARRLAKKSENTK